MQLSRSLKARLKALLAKRPKNHHPELIADGWQQQHIDHMYDAANATRKQQEQQQWRAVVDRFRETGHMQLPTHLNHLRPQPQTIRTAFGIFVSE